MDIKPRTATFKPIGEVAADDRARVAMGKVGVRRDDRYAVATNEDGEILLTPLVSIPKRELLIWENAQFRASLARGLEQSANGQLEDLGDFSQFIDETTDQD